MSEQAERERIATLMKRPNAVFVFGSNEAGRHGAGAALDAGQHYGAVYGRGYGLYGASFALPTKDRQLRTLSLERIAEYVAVFLAFAREHPELDFAVTRIGCGLAGFKDRDVAPFFKTAPVNCHLPIGWRESADAAPAAESETDHE
jgi:hypothetical protein